VGRRKRGREPGRRLVGVRARDGGLEVVGRLAGAPERVPERVHRRLLGRRPPAGVPAVGHLDGEEVLVAGGPAVVVRRSAARERHQFALDPEVYPHLGTVVDPPRPGVAHLDDPDVALLDVVVGRGVGEKALAGAVAEIDHCAASQRLRDDGREDRAAGRRIGPRERVAGGTGVRDHRLDVVGVARHRDALPVAGRVDRDGRGIGRELAVEPLADRRRGLDHLVAGLAEPPGERRRVDAPDPDPRAHRASRVGANRTRSWTVGPSVSSTVPSASVRPSSTYAPHVSNRSHPRRSAPWV